MTPLALIIAAGTIIAAWFLAIILRAKPQTEKRRSCYVCQADMTDDGKLCIGAICDRCWGKKP